MKTPMLKTNVMRLLDRAHLPYTPHEYQVDENDLSGEHTAGLLGLDPAILFKTLVARGEKGRVGVFCIPCREELDLKKAARAFGEKKLEMVHVRELKDLTGYVRGGCSPIGMKKPYPVFLDESCSSHPAILVSAGARGFMVELRPQDLMTITHATPTPLTRDSED